MTPTGYAMEYPMAGSRLPTASMAACSAGVQVIEPANSPTECAGDAPKAAPSARAIPSAAMTPTAPSRFHFRPGPRRPAKNWAPYWMPTPYRNMARPIALTSPGGVAPGAMAPMASPAKSTAPTPSENPAIEI